MSARRSLILGLLLSLVVHAGLALAPGWRLPEDDRPLPLTARLLAAPGADSATTPAPKALPKTRPRPKALPPPERPNAAAAVLPDAPEPAASAPESASAPAASSEPALAQSAPAASEPVVAASEPATPPQEKLVLEKKPLDWPRSGKVSYRNFGIMGGTGTQQWQHDGAGFLVTLSVQALGQEWKQEASGRILGGQLNVDGFRQTNRGRVIQGLFDLPAGKVSLIRDGQTVERKVEGAAFDLATLPHFLAQAGEQIEAVEFYAVVGRGVERTIVANRGVRKVQLPIGEVSARYFYAESRNGQYKIEIWLARDWKGAPVRIVVDDRDGFRFDVQATEVEIDGTVVATTPVTLSE